MPVPRDEPRRSNLTFVACEGRTEFISFDRLQRVREPVSRSKSGVQGKVADVLHGRSRHAESGNELKAFQVLMATGRADDWQEQPFHLEYQHEGAKHRYTPDILVAWGKHQEVVEVKDDAEAELPENQARFALIGNSWPSTAIISGVEKIRDSVPSRVWRMPPSAAVPLRCGSTCAA